MKRVAAMSARVGVDVRVRPDQSQLLDPEEDEAHPAVEAAGALRQHAGDVEGGHEPRLRVVGPLGDVVAVVVVADDDHLPVVARSAAAGVADDVPGGLALLDVGALDFRLHPPVPAYEPAQQQPGLQGDHDRGDQAPAVEADRPGEGAHPFAVAGPDEPGGAGEDRAVVLLDAVDPAVRSRGVGAGDEGDVAGELAAAGLEVLRGPVPEIDDAPADRPWAAIGIDSDSRSRCRGEVIDRRAAPPGPAVVLERLGADVVETVLAQLALEEAGRLFFARGCRRNSCRSRRRGSRGWSGSPAR